MPLQNSTCACTMPRSTCHADIIRKSCVTLCSITENVMVLTQPHVYTGRSKSLKMQISHSESAGALFLPGIKPRHACPCNWHLCRRLAGSENTIYFIYWSGFSPASCSVTTVLAWVTSVIGHHGLGFGHLVPALYHDLVFVGYGFDLCQHGPAFCDHSWYHCCW